MFDLLIVVQGVQKYDYGSFVLHIDIQLCFSTIRQKLILRPRRNCFFCYKINELSGHHETCPYLQQLVSCSRKTSMNLRLG